MSTAKPIKYVSQLDFTHDLLGIAVLIDVVRGLELISSQLDYLVDRTEGQEALRESVAQLVKNARLPDRLR